MPNRRLFFICSCFLVLLAACEPPAEVQLIKEDNGVEVTSLVLGDTTFALSQIDTNGVLPREELAFSGTFVVNNVQHDDGQGVRVASFARAIVMDRNKPVQIGDRTFGYHGADLGSLYLSGNPMVRREHRVPVSDLTVAAGFEYGKPEGLVYEPSRTYIWTADSIGGIGVPVDAPGLLMVQSPIGGSTISSDADLELRWTSEGDVVIVISMFQRFAKVRPMLQIKPRGHGSAVVPAKVLQLLPRDHLYFFTFIQANRREVSVTHPFLTGIVLVQAASVYNSVVVLR